MRAFRDKDLDWSTLAQLLRAEIATGILGLRLFIACTAVASLMMGAVWMLGGAMASALERNGFAILGGNAAINVVNQALDDARINSLRSLPGVSGFSAVADLRSTARTGDQRVPIELKAVDNAYPLFGTILLSPPISLESALAVQDGVAGAVVEETLLSRLSLAIGDRLMIGEADIEIRAVIDLEPDRLSSGGFMVGPRVMVSRETLDQAELLAPGALVDFRYRLRLEGNTAETLSAFAQYAPETGWELQTPADSTNRVRRMVERTTTFLGLAGIVALAIGLAGAWTAATVWINRRSRTIALYRLSGATTTLVLVLHATIIAIAATTGIAIGTGLAAAGTLSVMDGVASRLHLPWAATDLIAPALVSMITLVVGLAGAVTAALSAAARTSPGIAMRSGEAPLSVHPRHWLFGLGGVMLALTLAVVSLPYPGLAASAAVGLVLAAILLAVTGYWLARAMARRQAKGFVSLLALQGLSHPYGAAMKALTIGIGIAGITAVLSAQSSLDRALRAEIPDKAPNIVLLDVQQDQVDALTKRIEDDPDLGGLQAVPFMRMTLLEVNGVPVEDALINDDKRWVIEGDRSFAWSAGPTQAELVAGSWWDEDYTGSPVVAPEEDIAQAFDLQIGDQLTYSVLGRTFTSEVVAIRLEYHRTLRPEQLLLASAEPFRNAPHSWIMTLQGNSDTAIDTMIRDVSRTAPNITAIDVRRIEAQIRQMIDGASLASLSIAAVLLLAGALTLSAVMAADVDSRRREALAFTLIGAGRSEIARARVLEFLVLGTLSCIIGGAAGLFGGWALTATALSIAWNPGWVVFMVLGALGLAAAFSASVAGSLSALPRGRGQVARHLAG